jgi:hypothetical protein
VARIILGLGASHSPLMALEGARWTERSRDDMRNLKLNMSDGRYISYDQLAAETGAPWGAEATEKRFNELEVASQAALDRLAAALEAAAPDVVVIVGDDQTELFDHANLPALSVFHGSEVVMHPMQMTEATPDWRRTVAAGYAMDEAHVFPGHPALARTIIAGLMERDFDVAVSDRVADPVRAGFGHAYGFIIHRLFKRRRIPVVPVLLNTYYPPNVPSPKRCLDLGRALRAVIESSPEPLRVAIAASGGLSHFVVDEALDRSIVSALQSRHHDVLARLPVPALNAGSSEIRNWIVTAGSVEGLSCDWVEYHPIRRTPAGTGVGVAFALWS